ncbi:MAG TPA: hypothetical protein VIU63_05530 [Nitrospira sp.]
MKTTVFTKFAKRTMSVLVVLLAASLGLLVPTLAADQQPSTVLPGSDTTIEQGIAAGAAEDTLRACMDRIPQNASIGQLMIAEQGCWRDENDRKPVQAVPGARTTSVIGPALHSSLVRSGHRLSMSSLHESP